MTEERNKSVKNVATSEQAKLIPIGIANLSIPPELFAEIISYLDFSKLAELIRVNKSFKYNIENISINGMSWSKKARETRNKYTYCHERLKLNGGFFAKFFKEEFLSDDAVIVFKTLIAEAESFILKKLLFDYLQFHNPDTKIIDAKISKIFSMISEAIDSHNIKCLQVILKTTTKSLNIGESVVKNLDMKSYLSAVIGKGYYEFIPVMYKLNLYFYALLEHAVSNDHQGTVEFLLLQHYGSRPEAAASPLICAVYCEDVRALDYLIRKGRDVNETNTNNTTALHVAIHEFAKCLFLWQNNIVEKLIDAGADVKISSKTLGLPIEILRKRINMGGGYSEKKYNLCINLIWLLQKEEILSLLAEINHLLGLNSQWQATFQLGLAACPIEKEDLLLLDGYCLTPIKIIRTHPFDNEIELLTLYLDAQFLEKNILLDLKSKIKKQTSLQSVYLNSNASSKLADNEAPAHQPPVKNENLEPCSPCLQSITENRYIFNYDDTAHEEHVETDDEQVKTDCNN